MTVLATIPARKTLPAFLAACSMEQLVAIAHDETGEYDDCPDWLLEACYDEADRRMFDGPAKIAAPVLVLA